VTKTVKVGIPAGIESGMRLRVTGQGEEGPAGTPNGDLYVAVGVTPDPRFERQGPDLGAEVHVPMVKACLGGTFTFEALDGAVEVTLEPGTQPGTVLRVRGRGLPRIDNRSGRGDLHLRVAVDIPRRLTPAQIDLLKAFDSADSPAAT
jgi:molecular chaperone DnaJ